MAPQGPYTHYGVTFSLASRFDELVKQRMLHSRSICINEIYAATSDEAMDLHQQWLNDGGIEAAYKRLIGSRLKNKQWKQKRLLRRAKKIQ